MNLVIYGPPGAGKSTIGLAAARRLGREFVDGDAWIEARWNRPIPDYFQAGEEDLFRAREAEAYRLLAARSELVIAPGGGALVNPRVRAALEATGLLVCLTAPLETLLARLDGGPERPLLRGDPAARLRDLLAQRAPLYNSIPVQVDTANRTVEGITAEVLAAFEAGAGERRFHLGAYTAAYGHGLLAGLAQRLAEHGLRPAVVISDSHVAPLHGQRVADSLGVPLVTFPAGEAHKNLDTARALYSACLAHGLERGSTIVAVGGGVVGDVAGFVAATLLRGVGWVNVPTTVLAMADAGLGGKVGVDLPEGKNLVGAFHPPALVVADTQTLETLPAAEHAAGMAEVVKSAIIGDPDLFEALCAGSVPDAEAIVRAAGVKAGIVNADPYERGERALLNLGHTIGHGLEAASGFRLRHGEAISVGLVAEATLAERLGLAGAGLAEAIGRSLGRLNLPLRAPGVDPRAARAAMSADKKKAGGRLKFVLPRAVGDVLWGVDVDETLLAEVLEAFTHD